MTIPQFKPYVCMGDSVSWTKDGFELNARLVHDDETTPDDADCYDEMTKQQWHNDDWGYCGVVLSIAKNGIVLDTNASSLWGVEYNLRVDGIEYEKTNSYLSEVASELEDEAITRGKKCIAIINKE